MECVDEDVCKVAWRWKMCVRWCGESPDGLVCAEGTLTAMYPCQYLQGMPST